MNDKEIPLKEGNQTDIKGYQPNQGHLNPQDPPGGGTAEPSVLNTQITSDSIVQRNQEKK